MVWRMRYGFYLPTRGQTATPEGLETLVQRGEALGFASVMIADHLVFPVTIKSKYPYTVTGVFPGQGDVLDQLSLMAFVAAKTTRLRLVTSVMIVPYRNPVLTAKALATIDVLSKGRVTVGVGVGWMREEFEALGAPDFDRRGAVTDEYLRIFKTLWTESPASFSGRFYRFDSLRCLPHPVQRPHPPIWVGGHSKPALRRAAQLGDGWHPVGANPAVPLPAAELRGPRRALSPRRGSRTRSRIARHLVQGAGVRREPAGTGRRASSVLGERRPDRGRHRRLRASRRERARLRFPQREPRREPRSDGKLRPSDPKSPDERAVTGERGRVGVVGDYDPANPPIGSPATRSTTSGSPSSGCRPTRPGTGTSGCLATTASGSPRRARTAAWRAPSPRSGMPASAASPWSAPEAAFSTRSSSSRATFSGSETPTTPRRAPVPSASSSRRWRAPSSAKHSAWC